MIIIPAVDIKDGKCVRLEQGRMDAQTVFSDDPVAMALKWEQAGAEIIHVVDLDGAIEKFPRNLKLVRRMIERVQTPIHIGGGVRDLDMVAMLLEIGAERVILGTEALRNTELVKTAGRQYPDRIIVAIDARDGKVAVEGWTETTGMDAVELGKRFEDCGVAAINFTDIQRDGMQTGVNLVEIRRMAEALAIPVVASGGVATLKDIEDLLPLTRLGVTGVIVGRALYSGAIDLQEAIALARQAPA